MCAKRKFNAVDYLELYHLLFDSNHIGITVVQPDGTIIYYNDAQSRLDSLPPEKALGNKICEVYNFTEEDSPTMRAIHTGQVVSDQVHFYRTRHGKLVNSTCDVYPLLLEGKVMGALCCIHGYPLMDQQICSLVNQPEAVDERERSAGGPPAGRKLSSYRFSNLVGKNAELMEARAMARQAARSTSPVMLVGETGVGKEIFAQSIHYASARGKHSYTAINCSAVPENLLEGILFGTTRGAYTGAIDKAGLFEMTQKGTLFLDELDSMPVSLQSKLLRVLQEKQVRRIGDSRERELDVRIISSVSRNPMDWVSEGVLRADFYYRLGVVKIFIPPLRQRLEDLHLLAQHFVKKHSLALGLEQPLLTPEAMGILYNHSWPGNVRELEHAIEASLNVLGDDASIKPEHLRRACPDIFPEDGVLPSKTTPWLAYQAYLEELSRSPEQQESLDGSEGPGRGPAAERAEQPPRHAGAASEAGAGRAPAVSTLPVSPRDTEAGPCYASGFKGAGAAGLAAGLEMIEEAVGGRAPAQGLLDRKQSMERETIRQALRASAGNMALAARLMRISPQLMQYKVKKHGINVKEYVPNSM